MEPSPASSVLVPMRRLLAALTLASLPVACSDAAFGPEPAPPGAAEPSRRAVEAASPASTPEPGAAPSSESGAPSVAAPAAAPGAAPAQPASDGGEAAPPSPPQAPTAGADDKACGDASRRLVEGAAAMAKGDLTGGRATYLEILKHSPSCPQVPHVYLAFAERAFASGELSQARQLYAKAATFTDLAVAAYAHYKAAWCDLNLGEATEALRGFVKVVQIADEHRSDPEGDRAGLARLRLAALRDSAAAYAVAGDPRKAALFYRHIAGEADAEAALRRVVQIYRDRGDAASADSVCGSAGAGVCAASEP